MNSDFKIPERYLIDFDNLKVGDRVWTINNDYCIVEMLNKSHTYPITAGSVYYTKDGKMGEWHKYPSLFRSNPFEDIREGGRIVKATASLERTIEAITLMRGFDISPQVDIHLYNLQMMLHKVVDELNPPSEELVHLTLKDISEGRGKGVPAHLIRIKE